MSATTTQLLSSVEFCKLRYDTTPVKSSSANDSFYTNNFWQATPFMTTKQMTTYAANYGLQAY